jgi:hypothetical protein
MSISITDFSKWFKTSYKHGSLIIAIIIPIVILLDIINFVSPSFMIMVNEIIIGIELGLAFIKLGLNEYLKGKTLVNEVKMEIAKGQLQNARNAIKDNVSETIDLATKTTKDIIKTAVKAKAEAKKAKTEIIVNVEPDKPVPEINYP